MLTFHTLGTVDLKGSDGRHLLTLLSGPKRIALLSYLTLATPRGPHRRDQLLALLWPDTEQRRARNALNNLLYHLREVLGRESILAVGTDGVGLAEGVIRCDALEFETAIAEARYDEALDLYRGDLLDGFFVPGGTREFEEWLDATRARFRREAAEAARLLLDRAVEVGDDATAIRWARRASALEPYDERVLRSLVSALERSGDRVGALRTYDEFAEALERELQLEPAAETRRLIERIRVMPGTDDASAFGPNGASPAVAPAPEPRRPDPRAIAILPFDEIGESGETAPLAAGLHSDLLTKLSGMAELRTISRTSVARYAGAQIPIPEIARRLGVGTVLEGGVQHGGGRVRLSVRLIDAHSDRPLWSATYDRRLSTGDLFEIQNDLTERIVASLRAELTPGDPKRVEAPATADLEAYRLHAQGRRWMDQRTPSGLKRATEYFRQAVAKDPGYSLGWVGLGDALALQYTYGYENSGAVLEPAEAAVQRALALDPELAEGYASLAHLRVARRDGPAAIEGLRRAIAIRPGYAEAHNWLSYVHQLLGDRDEALASATRAVELDPLSSESVSNLSLSHLTTGAAERALIEGRRVRELQPEWNTGPFLEGVALCHLGRYPEARAVLEGLRVEWAGYGAEATLALCCASCGDLREARTVAERLDREDDGFAAALASIALGDRAGAYARLDAAEEWNHFATISMHHLYPDFLTALRADPLYERLMERIRRSWGRTQ